MISFFPGIQINAVVLILSHLIQVAIKKVYGANTATDGIHLDFYAHGSREDAYETGSCKKAVLCCQFSPFLDHRSSA